jgi:hypothetical protein
MYEEPEAFDGEERNKMAINVFCTNCGTKLDAGDAFCVNCGASAVVSESSPLPLQSTDYLPTAQQKQHQQPEQQYNQQPEQQYYQQPEQQYYQQPEQQYYQQPEQQHYQQPEQQYYQQPEQQYYQQQPIEPQNQSAYQQPAAYMYQPRYKGDVSGTTKKKKLSNSAIISIVVACTVLFGVGLFLFIDPLNFFSNSPMHLQPKELQPPDEDEPSPEQEAETPAQEPTPPIIQLAVTSINIIYMGADALDIPLTVGEEVSVQAMVEPYIDNVTIEWTSSDTEVFIVMPFGATGNEARVEAVSQGFAILTAKSGDVIRECYIIVQEVDDPQYQDSTLGEFYANINNTNVELRLVVSWVSGPQTGRESIYWRERNSSSWQIRRVGGNIDTINPEFGYNDSVLTILWPIMDYNRTHYLFEDGTGYFSKDYRHANSVYEDLRWELTILE